jgi:Domain of unknown function (DUF4913)
MTVEQAPALAHPAGHAPSDSRPAGGGLPPDAEDETAGAEVPEPVYTALEDWLIDYFLPMFRRTLGGEFRWCAQWWQHGEAISRLGALWRAWEVLRLQPGTGIGTWYREHLDHQLPILMGARGPFYQCSETSHREPWQAAAAPAPPGWQELSGSDNHPGAPDDEHASAGTGHDGA